MFNTQRQNAPINRDARAWVALRYFNLYRLIIAGLFALLATLGRLPPMFTQFDVRLLAWSAMGYLFAAIGLQIAIERRWANLYRIRNVQVLVDVGALTLLMHASGGAAGGFGVLLVVAIAGACLIARWQAAVSFAAVATLAVLGETVYGTLKLGYEVASYTQAGLLGAALFGTAILASVLAEQARGSEALAALRALHIERLSQLNQHIVQRMRSGIVVLDAEERAVLVNESARKFLNIDDDAIGGSLLNHQHALATARTEWRTRGENRKTPLKLERGAEVIVSFTQLGDADTEGTLVFIEDAAESQQRAQQIKLASLGRLTASIAHEIRNPLGAISHAGQLLSESPELNKDDLRLTQIIVEHAARMNEIVKNVMMIGRRDLSVSESFLLQPWLEKFIAEFREQRALSAVAVVSDWAEPNITVRMDKSQLHQVLWNLCENALRYSTVDPKVRFAAGRAAENGRPYIDLIDTGPGMSKAFAEQVFEPFFTGERGGTGLGLYIARELCEANQATLRLLDHDPSGCHFRLTFAHPARQQLSAP